MFTTSLEVDIDRHTDVAIDSCQDACWEQYSEALELPTEPLLSLFSADYPSWVFIAVIPSLLTAFAFHDFYLK